MKQTIRIIARKVSVLAITIRYCRNWIPVSLARAGFIKGRFPVESRLGVKIKPWVSVRANWGSIFEPLLSDVYGVGKANNPDIILDVGANHGAFSALASFLYPQARVVAYEPNEKIWDLLDHNLQINGGQNVEVIHSALAADKRDVVFYDSGGGGSSSYVLPGENARKMQTTSLNQIEWRGARRLFIKLDCEGAEGEIIEWICRNLSALPANIQIAGEYHPWCPLPLPDAIQMLRNSGFTAEVQEKYGEEYLHANKVSDVR